MDARWKRDALARAAAFPTGDLPDGRIGVPPYPAFRAALDLDGRGLGQACADQYKEGKDGKGDKAGDPEIVAIELIKRPIGIE